MEMETEQEEDEQEEVGSSRGGRQAEQQSRVLAIHLFPYSHTTVSGAAPTTSKQGPMQHVGRSGVQSQLLGSYISLCTLRNYLCINLLRIGRRADILSSSCMLAAARSQANRPPHRASQPHLSSHT
jgi:hypothetical protein